MLWESDMTRGPRESRKSHASGGEGRGSSLAIRNFM